MLRFFSNPASSSAYLLSCRACALMSELSALQRLLHNAKTASAAMLSSGSSGSSTASISGSEDEHDLAPAPAACSSDKVLKMANSTAAQSSDSTARCNLVHSAGLGSIANNAIMPDFKADREAPTFAGATKAPEKQMPETSQQDCTPNHMLHCQPAADGTDHSATPLAALPAAPSASSNGSVVQASCLKAEQPVCPSRWLPSWYSVTQAANMSTRQGSSPQPWWKPDSWLTAPAELQFQRSVQSLYKSANFHGCCCEPACRHRHRHALDLSLRTKDMTQVFTNHSMQSCNNAYNIRLR